MPTDDLPQIPDLTVEQEIGRGAHSVVYRALRGGRPFAVKVRRSGVDDSLGNAALRFRREAAVLACLRHPGLPAILALGETGGRPYIVQEFVDGDTLSQRVTRGPLTEPEIQRVAERLAGALAEVHRHGMVHCDVKPDNILVDGSGEARLIDFGFAVRASEASERQEVMGTLLYSAPEQTGMLKRPLDGRSNLYALGVVLYECATGIPPFRADDTGELVRLHLVAEPPDIRERNPAVSPALAAVITKLLSKDPDDRYQTGTGFLADLRRLDALNRELAQGRGVSLGLGDRAAEARSEFPLIGRETELEQLQRAWDRLLRGRGAVILVEGERGLGKGRLLGELVDRVREGEAPVLAGRCVRDSPQPFGPLREAILSAVHRLQRLPEGERSAAAELLRRSAGDAAPLLRGFTPELAAVLGEAPEASAMTEVQDQFYDALAHFLLRYAGLSHRVLIALEDVQWLDDASRQVLARLATRIRGVPLLIVATTSSGASQDSGRDRFVADMGSAISERLTLQRLDDHQVGRLVAAQLGDSESRLEVAARISARSHGSPLAAVEMVRSMLNAGLLRPSWGTWSLDEEGLAELDLPTDVRDLVVRRVATLSEPSRSVLHAAAIIGTRFDLELLGTVCGLDDAAVLTAVAEALRTHVVEARGSDRYAFVHTEVREALLAELQPDTVCALHQQVAESLQQRAEADEIYAVAQHYLLGEVGVDPGRAFEANFAAGRYALQDYAHEEAYGFLQHAQRIAREHDLSCPTAFYEAFGEVCARTGRLAEAIEFLERTLADSSKPLRRAQIRARLVQAHVSNFHTEPALREARAGFRELGAYWPRTRPMQLLSALVSWIRGGFRRRFGRANPQHPKREWYETFVRLCEYAAVAGYFSSRPLMVLQMAMRSYPVAARIAPSRELSASLSQQSVVYAVAGLQKTARRTIARAMDIALEADDRLALARCQMYHGFTVHLCGDAVEAETMARRGLEEHGEWLDSMHFLDASGDLVFNLFLRGYYREAWSWIERQLPRMWFVSGGVGAKQGNPWAGAVLAGLGRAAEGLEFQDLTRDFVEGAPRTERYIWGEYLSYNILFQLEQGELGLEIDESIAEHRQLGLRPRTTSFHKRSFFIFQAHARLEQAMAAPEAQRAPALKRLKRALRELKAAVLIPSMAAHYLVIKGALRRLQGRRRRARKLFERADQMAEQIDSPWVAAEVARQRATLLAEQGRGAAARREAQVALNLALQHGWVFRARRIREAFLAEETSRPSLVSTPTHSMRDTSYGGNLQLRRQLDALLQVSLASGTVLDPVRQARATLDEIVRILGAERGFLFHCGTEDAPLLFQAGRDGDGNDLDSPTGYSSTVVETVRLRGEPLIVSGSRDGALLGAESVATFDLRSIVAAPLLVRDRVVGVIYLDSRLARGVFTEDDMQILLALGNHIAVALETARAAQVEIRYEAETQQRQLAETLRDQSHALSSTLNLDEVLARLLEGVRGMVDADRAAVYLREGDTLRRASLQPAADEGCPGGPLTIDLPGDPLFTEVVKRRAPVTLRDTTRDNRVMQKDLLRSWLGVPLITQDRVAGVLTLESRQSGAYDESDAEIAFTFAGQAGIAIENARLFGEVQRLAITDGLTGLHNRRHFFAVAEREFSRARRHRRPISAIMLDVDHFKRVNDTHGHAVGDQVLQAVAGRCQDSLREEDILGRYGGEEFAFLLPDTALDGGADRLAERLRRVVGDQPIDTNQGALQVTVSLGVAEATAGISDLSALLDRADTALYLAKERGRNRVEVKR